jgi:hypothetical protein
MTELSTETVEKMDATSLEFIESQATLTFDFVMESRALLHKEALTTMNWLIGIMIGSFTLAVSILDKWHPSKAWLLWGLGTALIGSSASALNLLFTALLTSNVLPPGSEPKNLMTADWINANINSLRWATTKNMQEKIDVTRSRNHEVGESINLSRKAIFGCLGVAIVVALIAKGCIISG